MMLAREWLLRQLRYDEWANRKWIESFGGFRAPERAHEIMHHILWAQEVWLRRVNGVEFDAVDDHLTRLERNHEAWKSVLSAEDLERPIIYRRLNGDAFTSRVDDIASHMLNHGTYHRGQLRGLAEAQDFNEFPETDLISFLREPGVRIEA